MRRSGSQVKQLQQALLSAFPNRSSLEQMVRFELDENLRYITDEGSISDTVFSLIRWAEAQGKTQDLVNGAIRFNPSNPELRILTESFESSGESPTTEVPDSHPTANNQNSQIRDPSGQINFPESLYEALNQPNWIPPTLQEERFEDTGIYPSLDAIIRSVKIAVDNENILSRRRSLEEALNQLDKLKERVRNADIEQASVWYNLIEEWQKVTSSEIQRLSVNIHQVSTNPYQIGNPLKPEQQILFKGRRDLRDKLVNALLEGSRPTVVLHGPRRMGKTSFLLQLPELLPGDTIPVYMDLQRPAWTKSDDAFLFYIADSIHQTSRPYKIKINKPNRKKFKNDCFETFERWLAQEVEPALNDLDFDLLLAFDEFEKLGQSIEKGHVSYEVLDELRHLIQHNDRIAFLFAGVQTIDALGPNWSTYFVNVKPLPISYLTQDEATELITSPDPTSTFNLVYEPKVVDEIIRLTKCHPLLLQLLCSCCVDIAIAQRKTLINNSILKNAVEMAFEQGETLYFRNVWDEMANKDGQPLLQDIIAGRNPVTNEHETALNRLLQLRVISKAGSSRRYPKQSILKTLAKVFTHNSELEKPSDNYVIEIPLVEQWLKRNIHILAPN